MRYFTDEQLKEMEQKIKSEFKGQTGTVYLAYLEKITELNRQCAEGIDKHKELTQAISEMQLFSERYIPHGEKVDINDEDADAYEYENYDYGSDGDS